MPRAVVLIIDGLGAKHLGPYGNTWIETPAFNHLATESLLFESMYAPHDDCWKSLDAMWRERTVFGQPPGALENDLLSWLGSIGINTKLLTDDADLVDQRLAANFAEQVDLEPARGIKLASEWDETHTAQFFAQAVNAIEQLEDDCLLWLQTRGFGNPWDAPYEFRCQFADEDDPEPTGSAQVPSLLLDEDYDPDTLHEIQCAFAGQVVLFDQCLGVLLSVIRESPRDLLFVLTSLRGFPLGEHLRVGWSDASLYHELLHVPGFVRRPDGSNAMRRWAGIGELGDISNELVNWFQGQELAFEDRPQRLFSLSHARQEVLLRTPTWQLRFAGTPSVEDNPMPPREVYLKPDDQNEVNDVADRRNDVVEAGWELIQRASHRSGETNRIEVPSVLQEAPE